MATNKIYMDACCYIDIVEGVKKNAALSHAEHCRICRQFMEAALNKKIQLFGSFLMIVECTYITIKEEKIATDKVKAAFDNIFISGKIMTPIQPTPKIIHLAREMTWEHKLFLDAMDSIHLATAKVHDCELFITRDNKVLKLADKIKALFGMEVCQGQEATNWLPAEYRNPKWFD